MGRYGADESGFDRKDRTEVNHEQGPIISNPLPSQFKVTDSAERGWRRSPDLHLESMIEDPENNMAQEVTSRSRPKGFEHS
jgi:hypothetical protein